MKRETDVFVISFIIIDSEPEVVKMTKDNNDYEHYGGNIPPRSGSAIRCKTAYQTQVVSEKEHRANQFDFSATQSKWVKRDISAEPGYKRLSSGFKKLFNNPNVTLKQM